MLRKKEEEKVTSEIDESSLPWSIQSKNRVDKPHFMQALFKFWREKTLEKYPNQCHSVTGLKIAEQAWQDYQTICELFDSQELKRVNVPGGYQYVWANSGLIFNKLFFDDLVKREKHFQSLPPKHKEQIRMTINLPFFSDVFYSAYTMTYEYFSENTMVLDWLSCTVDDETIALMRLGADINKFSVVNGSNPLLLAISKGWNHSDFSTRMKFFKLFDTQKKLIDYLLTNHADVNVAHLANGMTPLHIACLRGDDPALIKKLINSGATLEARDYENRTPLDLLALSYDETKEIILFLTNNYRDNECRVKWDKGRRNEWTSDNKSCTATLPTRLEREKNQVVIKGLLESYLSPRKKFGC